MSEVNCPICNSPVSPKLHGHGGTSKKFCSKACRWAAYYHRHSEHRLEANRRFIKTTGYKKKRDPIKYKAQQTAMRAVRAGKLMRPLRCSKCGEMKKPDAHHADYTKPLDVVWLCRLCHRSTHRAEHRSAIGVSAHG